MPENEPDDVPRVDAPAPVLQYSRPTHGMAPVWQWVLGILLSLIFILGSGFLGAIAMRGFIFAPLVAALFLATVGAQLQSSVAYRPMAAGIWTGIALGVLLEGLCWVAFSG